MTRRALSRTDSLEMLLDTMCNTFGVIILISLMIALLSRSPSPETSQTTSSRQPNPLSQVYEEASSIHTALIAQAEAAKPTLHLLEEINAIRQRLAVAATHREQNQRNEDRAQADFESATRTNRYLEQKQGELRELINRLVEETSAVSNRRKIDLNPPLYRAESSAGGSTPRSRWDMIVQYGRLYPVRFKLANGTAQNSASIQWNAVSGAANQFELRPIQSAGLDFVGNPGGLDQLLKTLSSRQVVLHFFLYEDSFDSFPQLRKAVVNGGFGYNVAFLRSGEVVTSSPSVSAQEVGALN